MTVVAEPRPRRIWDVVLSIVLLAASYATYWVGAAFAFVSLAFLDSCSNGCSATDASAAQTTTAVVLFALGLLATAGTVVLLVLRRLAWWLPMALLVATAAGWIVGFIFYALAVGG